MMKHFDLKPYKSRGVVIFDSLGISKSLQDGVSLQQLLLQLSLIKIKNKNKINKKYIITVQHCFNIFPTLHLTYKIYKKSDQVMGKYTPLSFTQNGSE